MRVCPSPRLGLLGEEENLVAVLVHLGLNRQHAPFPLVFHNLGHAAHGSGTGEGLN